MSKRKTRSLRILMIDDDSELSSVVVESLRDAGVEAWALRPTPSGSIDEMVCAVASFQPDAVLIDVVMPTDTAKLVHALRAEPALANARLFGCSGHAILAGSFSRLLDGFLHKPFRMSDLAEMLAEEFAPRVAAPKAAPAKPRAKSRAKPASRTSRARR